MLKSKQQSYWCCDVCIMYYKSRAGYAKLFFVSDGPEIGLFSNPAGRELVSVTIRENHLR